jgi:hypothetical protein
MTSTCLRFSGDLSTAWLAVSSALPSGVFPVGFEKRRAQSWIFTASKSPKGIASRAPEPLKTKRPASIFFGVSLLLVAKFWICLAIEANARLAMTYFAVGRPVASRTVSFMLPDVS